MTKQMSNAIAKVTQYIKKKDLTIVFFDLETQNLFEDIDPGLSELSYQQAKNRKRELMPKLKCRLEGFCL